MVGSNKFPVLPSIFCGIGIIILLTLCAWQVQRLQWKITLQAELDKAYAITSQNMPRLTEDDFRNADKNRLIRGHLPLHIELQNHVIMQGRLVDGKPMVAVVAVGTSKDLTKSVMVELGCADPAKINPQRWHAPITLDARGWLRSPQWSYFTPENNAKRKQWWRMDYTDFQNYFRKPFYGSYLALENT